MIDAHSSKKILIVTDAWYPQVNGVVRTLTHTKDCLMARGHQIEMITPQTFRTLPCPTYPEIRLALFPSGVVAKMIRTFSPDVIHIATEGPLGLAARNYCLRNGLYFTTAYHTRFPEYIQERTGLPLSVIYRFVRWFHRPSQAVMAPTDKVISDLKEWGVSNAVFWPRGVEMDLFKPALRRKKNSRPIFLYVGRVAVEKNIDAFLEAQIDGEKWIVGDGPETNRLKKAFPDTRFFGMKSKEELPEFYQKADVFVFPSRTDTFGLVLLEAMACGLPVAAYPVTGPIDVVGISGAGVLDDNLAAAMEAALKISRRKVRDYAEGFSWEAATEIFESYLVNRQEQDSYSVVDNPYKANQGMSRALKAFDNSADGVRFAINEESAFRQELLLALFLVPFAVWLPASLTETILMIASVLIVLIVELLNSSVEAAIDRISFKKHGLSKRAKDYGSAAVLLSLVLSGFIYICFSVKYLF